MSFIGNQRDADKRQIASIMAVDMARRTLGRIKVADEAMEERQRRKGQ